MGSVVIRLANGRSVAVALAASVPTAPDAPSGLTATATGTSTIDLAWSDNSDDETGFKVYRSTDNSTYTLIHTTAADATSYTASGLSAETLYYFKVSAVNAAGESALSAAASDTTEAAGGGAETISVTTPRVSKVAGYASAVAWDPTGLSGTVDIKLSTDNGATYPTTLTSAPAAAGLARFWVEDAYIASACKIKVTTGTDEGTTGAFAIVADTAANVAPLLVPGAGSSSVSDPGGSGPKCKARWDIVPAEEWTGTKTFGVSAFGATTNVTGLDIEPAGVECVAVRANGGAWAYVPVMSLNSDRAANQAAWQTFVAAMAEADRPPYDIVRPVQEYCFRLNAADFTEGQAVTLQAIAYSYRGTHRLLPDITVYPDRGTLEHQAVYVDSVNGNDANDGSEASPRRTLDHALRRLNALGKISGGIIYCKAGTYKLNNDSGILANNARWLSILPAPGVARSDAVLVCGADGGSHWQVAKTRIGIAIDHGTGTGTAMGVTNQAGFAMWLDNTELYGEGPNGSPDGTIPRDCASWNGFTLYFTDLYTHDTGSSGGGTQYEWQGELVRNLYSYREGGDRGKVPSLWLNVQIKDHRQHRFATDGVTLLDQHSNIIQAFGADSDGNRIICGLVSPDGCYAPLNFDTNVYSLAIVNTDWGPLKGADGNHGTASDNMSASLFAHITINAAWPFRGNVWAHANFHANDFHSIPVVSGTPTQVDWTRNNFRGGTAQGSNATQVASVSDNGGGLPVTPFDVLNRRRGRYSANHLTRQGAYAAAAEYTA